MKITYKNLKGRSGSYDLGRAALLTGPNMSGKSAALFAIHLALLGKLPAMAMGKGGTQDSGRLLKVMGQGSFAEIEIAGHKIRRDIEETPKKARVITRFDHMQGGDAEEEVATRLSGDIIYADFRKLVAAGDKERADILATYLPQPSEEDKRRAVIGQLLAHVIANLKPNRGKKPVEPESVVADLTADKAKKLAAEAAELAAANKVQAEFMELQKAVKDPDLRDVEAIIERLRVRFNEKEERRKTTLKVASETAALTEEEAEEAGQVEELEALVNQLRAVFADVRQQQKFWDETMARAESVGLRLSQYKSTRAELEAETAKKDGLAKALEAAVALEQAWAGRAPAPHDEVALARLEKQLTEAVRAQAGWQAQVDRWQGQDGVVEQLEARLAELMAAEYEKPKATMSQIQDWLDNKQREIATLGASISAKRVQMGAGLEGQCPIMGGACGAVREWAENIGEEVLIEEAALTQQQAAWAKGKEAAALASVAWAEYEAKVRDRDRAITDTTAKIAELRALWQAKEAALVHLATIGAEIASVERELELLRQQRATYSKQLGEYTAALNAAKEARRKAEADLAVVQAAERRLAEVDASIADLRSEWNKLPSLPQERPTVPDGEALAAAEERLKSAHAAQARVELLRRLDVDRVTVDAGMWKAAHRGAVQGLSDCIQLATTPVVGRITAALYAMGIAGSFFVDLGDKTFGIQRGDKWIDIEAMSGGEQVLFAAAMLAGLPKTGGLRVLTLESAELDGYWLGRLLAGLPVDQFDAVVVASCHTPETIPSGWNHVTMGKGV